MIYGCVIIVLFLGFRRGVVPTVTVVPPISPRLLAAHESASPLIRRGGGVCRQGPGAVTTARRPQPEGRFGSTLVPAALDAEHAHDLSR